MTTARFASAADAAEHDVAYWREIPAAERVQRVWTLSVELWGSNQGERMNADFVDLLQAFADADVRFLLGYHLAGSASSLN